MKYANLGFRKILGISVICIALFILVFTTAFTWKQRVGNFSIPAVQVQFGQDATMWRYRFEYAWNFLRTPASAGPRSFLAAIESTASFIFRPGPAAANASNISTQAIPVLVYHGIVSTPNATDVTIDTFKAQMFALKAAGWQTVSIYDFADAMAGKKTLPAKSFLLTFDDGRKDSYYPVDPILQALGYHAVMYVITGHSLSPGSDKSHYYLSAAELSTMLNSGRWDLQSHSRLGHSSYPVNASGTLAGFFESQLWIPTQDPGESKTDYENRIDQDFFNYYSLQKLWSLAGGRTETIAEYDDRIYTDLLGAKQDLENKLGVKVVSFAYPYNNFSQLVRIDTSSGRSTFTDDVNQIYDLSFYQWSPAQGYSQDYPGNEGQLLRRIEPKPEWSADHLLNLVTTGEAKSLPFVGKADGTDGWRSVWGTVTEANGTVSLNANTSTVGSLALLDGTHLWKDYIFTANFDWLAGAEASVVGRYSRDDARGSSYIDCDFGVDGSVSLRQDNSGTFTIISKVKNAAITQGSGKSAGIAFVGNYAECLWDGGIVLGAAMPDSAPKEGGPGVQVVDQARAVAALKVTGSTASVSAQ